MLASPYTTAVLVPLVILAGAALIRHLRREMRH
jgi:hypothetical protein